MRGKRWMVAGVFALLGANYPQPQGRLVNDFAGIIPDDTERALEAQLRAYEQATSIEVAVVTVRSLDGKTVEDYAVGLAKSWGVGKKQKDNGVVFLHASTEREMRIEVGYGLEPDLPDVVASRIIRETIIPAFKQGDFAGGTTAGVRAILEHLGTTPLEARAAERAREREEAARRGAAIMNVFKSVLLFGLLLIVVLLAIRAIRRAFRRAKLRRKVERDLVRLETTDLLAAKEQILRALEEAERVLPPVRVVELRQATSELVADLELGARTIAVDVRSLLRQSPERALRKLGAMETFIADMGREEERLRDRLQVYVRARDEAPRKLSDTRRTLADIRNKLVALREQGYHLDVDEVIVMPLAKLSDAESELALTGGHASDPERAMELAGEAMADARKALETREQWVRARTEVDAAVRELPGAIDEVRRVAVLRATDELTELDRVAPPAEVERVRRACLTIPDELRAAERLLDDARRANTMEVQGFIGALQIIEQVRRTLETAKQTLGKPAAMLKAIKEAKERVPGLRREVEGKRAEVARLIQNADVDSDAKHKAREAEGATTRAASHLNGDSRVDWVAAGVAFAAALDLFRAAEKMAKADIEEAEQRRERERRERERRRRAALSSGTSLGGLGGGGSRSSGFRFGGGGFGGGGASGRY